MSVKGDTTIDGIFELRNDLYYSRDHMWVRIEGCLARVGLDDFAQKLMVNVNEVILPAKGTRVTQNEPFASLRRIEKWQECHDCACTLGFGERHDLELISPISGVVIETNDRLKSFAETINEDPYGNGWIVLIKPASLKSELKELYFGQEAVDWLKREEIEKEEKVKPIREAWKHFLTQRSSN